MGEIGLVPLPKDWRGVTAAVVGAARQGVALSRFLLRRGARVVLTDRQPLEQLAEAQRALADYANSPEHLRWVCGGHPLELLDGVEVLFLSGGVPLDIPLVREAQRRGIPISNDSQVFIEVAPCKVVGITGSAGKTTTTTLVGRMAQVALENPGEGKASYRRVWVGGNIGTPLISQVDEISPEDLAILELSSFQLELMTHSPQVSAVLNITPNHLDRHGTMASYTAAKARILDFQRESDSGLLNRDDSGAWSLVPRLRGRLVSFGLSQPTGEIGSVGVKDGAIWLRVTGRGPLERVMEVDEVALRGRHNLCNVVAAVAIGWAIGLPLAAMRAAVKGFRGVPHRLEFVRSWGGADWYNDSIATAPERTIAAIQAFGEPLVLLLGGRDKNLDWDELADLVLRRVDRVVLFGEAAALIEKAIERAQDRARSGKKAGEAEYRLQTVRRCSSLRRAVEEAAQLVRPGDVVLLSPGGTSFDEFKDFEERGRCFARWVNELN